MGREDELARQLAASGLEVEPERRRDLLWLLEELLRWNRRVNLTAISDPGEGLEKHLVDSLTLSPLLAGDERILDLGSGGGFPGLALNIARPRLEVVSVDAVGKKIAFQRHVARRLGLKRFLALHARAEDLPRESACRGGFDLVVSRAFSDLETFATLALPMLRPGGRLVAMKGADGERELAAASPFLDSAGLAAEKVISLRLPVSAAQRTLLVLARKGADKH